MRQYVRALGNDLDRMQKEVMERCGITEVELERLKEHQEKKRKEEIQGQMNGRAITTPMATSCKRKWLWQNRSLSDGDKIVLVKALSGTLPHRINQTRGRQDQAENKCRKCRNVAETDCVSTNRASIIIRGFNRSHNWNHYNLNPLTRINWRASLVPAAAVIPASIAYIKVAAVKNLVP